MAENSPSQTHGSIQNSFRAKLATLYTQEQVEKVYKRLMDLIDSYPPQSLVPPLQLSEKDSMIIAYGDHLKRSGEKPLVTLYNVLQRLELPVSSLHLLPFYPYSSDDGFSVIDYYRVDPNLGDWEAIHQLSQDYRLMFDAVFNHISAKSEWFRGFLNHEAPYKDYFIVTDPRADLSLVTRPRTLPLLTPFETANGTVNIWTTFSDDQIDLNLSNPDVLLELIEILLFYVRQGAQFIRLDAIAFLWKQIGTTCLHLPETHLIIQIMRDVLNLTASQTILITETNVPHQENISYFGNGYNEAQLVYQFPLPPLILHTLRTGSAVALTTWAKGIQRVSQRTTFFNFTASHDGIGVRPVVGILKDADIDALVQMTQTHGGHVSYKSNTDGSQSPYELNITYFDAITDPAITAEQPDMAVARFMVSQAIMLAFLGVPGIYFPSLFGLRNDEAGVQDTGRYRTINREKLNADDLLTQLENPASIPFKVFSAYQKLLAARSNESAFHPLGKQSVLDTHSGVFAITRSSPDGSSRVLALHNVTDKALKVSIPTRETAVWHDLLDSDATYTASEGQLTLTLTPYQIAWLKAH